METKAQSFDTRKTLPFWLALSGGGIGAVMGNYLWEHFFRFLT